MPALFVRPHTPAGNGPGLLDHRGRFLFDGSFSSVRLIIGAVDRAQISSPLNAEFNGYRRVACPRQNRADMRYSSLKNFGLSFAPGR